MTFNLPTIAFDVICYKRETGRRNLNSQIVLQMITRLVAVNYYTKESTWAASVAYIYAVNTTRTPNKTSPSSIDVTNIGGWPTNYSSI